MWFFELLRGFVMLFLPIIAQKMNTVPVVVHSIYINVHTDTIKPMVVFNKVD